MKGNLLLRHSEKTIPLSSRFTQGLRGTLFYLSSKSYISYSEVSCRVRRESISSNKALFGFL